MPRLPGLTNSRLLHPSVLAGRWAAVSLGATLASGLWLRAAQAWPSLTGGANVLFGVHAHSHMAFFGWLVLAIASLAARHVQWTGGSAGRWRLVVHALGGLSLVALIGFALVGYAASTIALSALHVALWIPLVRLAWPMHNATDAERAWWQAAWIALLAAGAATLIPGVLAARGIRDGWWREFGIKLFLALFLNGFAGLAAMGIVVARGANDAATALVGAWVRRAIGIALVPLAVLYVATPPPVEWLRWPGRAAVGVVGIGTLTVVAMARRRPQPLWIRAALAALTVVGVLEGVAAIGLGATLMYGRPITVAFTHLLLLLAISPILAAALAAPHAPIKRPVIAAGGAAAMCAALAAIGWPWLGLRAAMMGLGPIELLKVAAIGGGLAALAWFALLPLLFDVRAGGSE